MNILFDSMGTQVQVQNETSNRLQTLFFALDNLGYAWSLSDYTQDLSAQLSGVDVLVILTHYLAVQPGYAPAIPADTSFAFSATDLSGIPEWVSQGGSLLLASNHTFFSPNDIALAAQFGITIVAAFFAVPQTAPGLTSMVLVTDPNAPDWALGNVEAFDSCGVSASGGTPIYDFPGGTVDSSGNDYNPADYTFAAQFTYGSGQVIVIGRSGIAGDPGSGYPAPGEIGNGSNLSFLLNCINALGGVIE